MVSAHFTEIDAEMVILRALRLAGCGPLCQGGVFYSVERLQYMAEHGTHGQSASVFVDLDLPGKAFKTPEAEARFIAWVKAQHAAEDAFYA